MGRRSRIKRLTRKQIERLMKKGKEAWISVNEILRHGKWRDPEDEEEDQ